MRIVAIDPGYAHTGQGCAVALLDGGRVVRAIFVRPERATAADLRVHADAVVWECPQVDARTRTATQEVVRLAAVGGTLAGMYAGACSAPCYAIAPSAWKGSTPKPVHHARLWAALDTQERDRLGGDSTFRAIEKAVRRGALERWGKPGGAYYPAAFVEHNLLDAVGLGLWYATKACGVIRKSCQPSGG
jgi:hypothetical protein